MGGEEASYLRFLCTHPIQEPGKTGGEGFSFRNGKRFGGGYKSFPFRRKEGRVQLLGKVAPLIIQVGKPPNVTALGVPEDAPGRNVFQQLRVYVLVLAQPGRDIPFIQPILCLFIYTENSLYPAVGAGEHETETRHFR